MPTVKSSTGVGGYRIPTLNVTRSTLRWLPCKCCRLNRKKGSHDSEVTPDDLPTAMVFQKQFVLLWRLDDKTTWWPWT